MKRTPRIIAVLVTAATLVLASCGDEFVEGGGSNDATTTTTSTPDAGNGDEGGGDDHEMGTADSPWPLIDGQPLPTGVVEGGTLVGQLRNLGAVEVPWTPDKAAQQVIGRTVLEPLFATSLAQEFGGDAAAQVAFWGLDGLWKDGEWTEAGDGFLKLLEAEIQDRFLGFADLPSGKVQVVLANAERDAVRMTFASAELKDVGKLVVFKTECGEVAVDVRGNLYVPCDCGRFKIETPPPPPPSTTTPGTTPGTGGKDHNDAPATTVVVTCDPGWHMSRETGLCEEDGQASTPAPDAGNPAEGDSGVGAPGSGVTPPATDPAPDPTVPTDVDGNGQEDGDGGPGNGSIADPGV